MKLTGEMGEFRRDPLGLLARLQREQGDVARMRLGLSQVLLFSHPALVEEVLVTKNQQFRKNPATRRLDALIGRGLLSSDGEDWKRQRHVTQPAFHRARIAGLADVMVGYTGRLLDGWQMVGEERDVLQEMTELTLRIACRSLFGADVAEDVEVVRSAMATVGEHFLSRFTSLLFLLPDSVPTPGNRRFLGAVKALDKLVYRIIETPGDDRGDLLSLLLASGLSPKQIRDEVMTFFVAGHETTSLALTWSLYLLAQEPDVWRRLQDEVDTVLEGRPPRADDVARLPFTRAVIDESLRLYPPAYMQGRQALRDTAVGGRPVKRGTTLLMSQWLIHRDPRFYQDPGAFRPERWLDGLAGRLPRFAYFPFGGGQRQCIGYAFAQMEAQLALACLAQRANFALVADQRIEAQALITLRPRYGIRMTVTRRSRELTAPGRPGRPDPATAA